MRLEEVPGHQGGDRGAVLSHQRYPVLKARWGFQGSRFSALRDFVASTSGWRDGRCPGAHQRMLVFSAFAFLECSAVSRIQLQWEEV